MIITGKTIFKIVYFTNLSVQAINIIYNISQHSQLDSAYLTIAIISVLITSLVYLIIDKKEKKDE